MRLLSILYTLFLAQHSFAQFAVGTVPASPETCSTIQLAWQGGFAPFTVSAVDAITLETLQNIGPFQSSPAAWKILITPGTATAIQIADSAGAVILSNAFKPIASSSGLQPPICRAATQGGVGDGPIGVSGAGNTTNSHPSGGDTGGDTGTGKGTTDGNGNGNGNGSGGDNGRHGDGPGSSAGSSNNSPSTSDSSDSNSAQSSEPASSSFSLPTNSFPEFTAGVDSATPSAPSDSLSLSIPNLSGPTTPPAIDIQPTTTPSTDGSGTSDGSNSNDSSANGLTKKGRVLSNTAIAGIVAGSVAAFVLLVFAVLRCRRRHRRARESVIYPFAGESLDHSASSTREMRGRAGYPASTFSSWGNHGDLATNAGDHRDADGAVPDEERAISPSGVAALTPSSEGMGYSDFAAAPQQQQQQQQYPQAYAYSYPDQQAYYPPQAHNYPDQANAYSEQPYDQAYAYPQTTPTPYVYSTPNVYNEKQAPPPGPPRNNVNNPFFNAPSSSGPVMPPLTTQQAQAQYQDYNRGHGHGRATSSSIDLGRNEPSSVPPRFRGQMQKSMVDAYRAGLAGPPSSTSAAPPPMPPMIVTTSPEEAQAEADIGAAYAYNPSPVSPNESEGAAMLPPSPVTPPQPQSPGHQRRRAPQLVVSYPPPYTSS